VAVVLVVADAVATGMTIAVMAAVGLVGVLKSLRLP
jgi:hypothetical protein